MFSSEAPRASPRACRASASAAKPNVLASAKPARNPSASTAKAPYWRPTASWAKSIVAEMRYPSSGTATYEASSPVATATGEESSISVAFASCSRRPALRNAST